MDVRKILQNINLILQVEREHQIQNMFYDVFSYYQSNDPKNLKLRKEAIYQAIKTSEINNLVHSDLNILEGVGVRGYFDADSLEKLENILQSPRYEAQNELSAFVEKREDLLQKIAQLQVSLEALDVKAESNKTYQIVLSLPRQYQDLEELEEFFKDIGRLLRELNSKDDRATPFKIASVNNGSMEFFIFAEEILINSFSIITDYIVQLHVATLMYERGKAFYEKYKEDRRKQADEIALENLKETEEQIMNELIEQLCEAPEEKTRIKPLIEKLVKHIQKGVHTEIKTPNIQEQDEISEQDDEVTIKKIEMKKIIDARNKQIALAQKQGIQLQLPVPDMDVADGDLFRSSEQDVEDNREE